VPRMVCLMSGGLDSTTLVAEAKSHDFEVYAMSFNYGQRHNIELTRAYELSGILGCKNHIQISIPNIIVAKGSLAGREEDIPEGHYADDNMASTIVPNRNALMLASAFAWAETLDADAVGIGAHAGDHPVYPDCRPEFLDAFEHMEHLALGRPVRLYRPFANADKASIVRLGAALNVPFGKTWSCYAPVETTRSLNHGAYQSGNLTIPSSLPNSEVHAAWVHCGRCGTCVERKEAFVQAQVEDPTYYADQIYMIQANQEMRA
jgi:7-cyano-7-deazaguanine synthase